MNHLAGKLPFALKRNAAAIIFLLLFCYGFLTTGDYGRSWDEMLEARITVANIQEYKYRFFGDEYAFGNVMGDIKNVKISENHDKDHGMAAYYAFVPIFRLTGFDTRKSMYAWHIYSFLLYFAGLLALYGILKEVFKNPVISMIGTLSYYFTPRFFAEGHYNDKDIVFVSLIFIMVFFMLKAIKNLEWKFVIPYAFFSGLVMNCKVLGIAVWGYFGVFTVIYLLLFNRKTAGRRIAVIFCAVLFSILFYILLTPASWDNPVEFLQFSLENASHFNRWDSWILYDGKYIKPAEQGLPYSYLPKWILMTIPEHVSVFFVISVIAFLCKGVIGLFQAIRHRKEHQNNRTGILNLTDFYFAMFLVLFLILFLYLLLKSPTLVLYNGWRHCYFLYVPITVCCVYVFSLFPAGKAVEEQPEGKPEGKQEGKQAHWRKVKMAGFLKHVTYGLVTVGLISTAADLFYVHPEEFIYLNRTARTMVDMEGYEGDYWNLCVFQMLDQFEEEYYEGKELTITLMGHAFGGQKRSIVSNGKLRYVRDEETPEYYLYNLTMIGDLVVPENFEEVSSISRFGRKIAAVYRDPAYNPEQTG